MHKDRSPDFKNKTVLFRTVHLESDATIEDPVFELQNGRLFVTGKMADGSSENDWLSGLVTSLAWDSVIGYVVFENTKEYLTRATQAWGDKTLQ